MSRIIAMFILATSLGLGTALAQESSVGAGRVEISAFPGGGMFFTQSSKGMSRTLATTLWAARSRSTSTAGLGWKVSWAPASACVRA